MTKTLYRIQFLNDKREPMTFYASTVNPSSFLGLIEASDILFMNPSEILVTPEDDKARKEFKNVERTFLPINSILRIDEVIHNEKETPIIRLHSKKEG